MVNPANNLLEKYNSVVAQQNEMVLNNHKQNIQLKLLRDWLLPMLMNGQVRVGNVEEGGELNMAAEPNVSYGQ